MNNDTKRLYYTNDLRRSYKQCVNVCMQLLNDSNFILFKYVHFGSLIEIAETNSITIINIIGPASREIKNHNYASSWVDEDGNFNLISDFAIILKRNTSTSDFLYTLPIWSSFVNKIIRIFKKAKVNYINY